MHTLAESFADWDVAEVKVPSIHAFVSSEDIQADVLVVQVEMPDGEGDLVVDVTLVCSPAVGAKESVGAPRSAMERRPASYERASGGKAP